MPCWVFFCRSSFDQDLHQSDLYYHTIVALGDLPGVCRPWIKVTGTHQGTILVGTLTIRNRLPFMVFNLGLSMVPVSLVIVFVPWVSHPTREIYVHMEIMVIGLFR